MKYILAVLLVLLFVGCGGDSDKQDNPPEVKDGASTPPSIPKI
jgi:hypothetical protein